MDTLNETNTTIYFKNYNYTFDVFFRSYTQLGTDLITNTDISKINSLIFSLISTYSYAIVDDNKKENIINEVYRYKKEINNNVQLKKVLENINLGFNDFESKSKYYKIYYSYLLKHLSIVGNFSEELGYTFMPQKTKKSKYIQFTNNKSFMECVTSIQHSVANKLTDFKLINFIEIFNSLLIYYHMFYLFIRENSRYKLDDMFSIVLSQILNKRTISILSRYKNANTREMEYIDNLEQTIFIQINKINSTINQSFSNYEIFPKIQKRIYIDKTLI